MPRQCHALTMPLFSRPRHSTAVERRPVGYLLAFGSFRLPRGVPRRLLSEAYQSSSQRSIPTTVKSGSRLRLKRDGTRAETTFRLSAKRTSTFKSAWASVQSTAGSRGVRISCSNAGYTMFRGSVTSTGYPLHLPVSPSLPLPCVTMCHQVSNSLYMLHCRSCWLYDLKITRTEVAQT
jgi:hypothetical protein